jgi:hypothetical protein
MDADVQGVDLNLMRDTIYYSGYEYGCGGKPSY